MTIDPSKAVVAAILFLYIWSQPVSGQQVHSAGDQSGYADLVKHFYGPDQILINGVLYYNRYARCKGHPYLMSNDFMDGELTLQGRNYPDLKLRYDISSQCVELSYLNMQGSRNWLFTATDHVEAFRLGEYLFANLDLDGLSRKFYQVIRNGFFTCYIHWEKRLLPIQNDLDFTNKFTAADADFLMEMDGKTYIFKSRKSLTQLFPAEIQKQIRRIFRRNHLKIKQATPEEMVRNMNAVADLLKTEVFHE